jgi:hypothetical protein
MAIRVTYDDLANVVDALRALPSSEATVREGAGFVEELAANSDPDLRAAARISVLQALEDQPT